MSKKTEIDTEMKIVKAPTRTNGSAKRRGTKISDLVRLIAALKPGEAVRDPWTPKDSRVHGGMVGTIIMVLREVTGKGYYTYKASDGFRYVTVDE